jgi:hypothetical protein
MSLKNINLSFAVYVRRLSCYTFYAASKIIERKVSLCGISYYKNKVKASDTIFIFGPGASILDYSKEDFNHIKRFDSISLNYAMLHEFEPTCYLFETHDTQDKGYFRFLSRKKNNNSEAYFLIKGYNSLSKFFLFLKNIKDFSKSEAKNLLLMKDGYLSDYKRRLTCQLSAREKSDFFINHLASIIYCLDLSIATGYKKIVFCGIDMNTDYFYFHKGGLSDIEKKNLSRSRHLNKHSKNKCLEESVLDYIQEVDSISNIKIYSYKAIGPLREILRQYKVNESQ